MIVQKRKKRTKEPKQLSAARQATLFGKGRPDPRMVGTLLHTTVNLLHDEKGPLTPEQRTLLLSDTDALARFVRRDLLFMLQKSGKMNLAIFFNELGYDAHMLHTLVTTPMIHYQCELAATGSVVFSGAERFQCKLLSTKNTFAGHPDRGGYVCLIGEFDQVRLRQGPGADSIPAIIEFKKGLGGAKISPRAETALPGLFAELMEDTKEESTFISNTQPTVAHAMQLLTYWIAFQTRWDISKQVKKAKGMIQEIPMSLHQPIELIIYNLNDGCQYQLCPSNYQEALIALIECIFYLNWAMKSGYAWQSPEHECKRTQLTEVPAHAIQVQVGYLTLTGQECYQLAKVAFERFKDTVQWKPVIA